MNNVKLRGIIQNIRHSHSIGDVEYDRAEVITKRNDNTYDSVDIKFKKFSCEYNAGDFVDICGNLRSFSSVVDGKNKCELYVFTYMDLPDICDEVVNEVHVDGRVCKSDGIRKSKDGKASLHFILANNMIFESSKQKLNSYIPCVVYGQSASENADLKVNDAVEIVGEIHSREYKKTLENGEIEIRVAHELFVKGIIKK